MSADNGIYILYTDSMDFDGPKYRVVHTQAIDSIYGKFNEETCKYEGDPEMIKHYFKDAKIFHTLNEAMDYAEELENDIGYTEDGICVINEFAHYGQIFD